MNGESVLCLSSHLNAAYHDWSHGFCFVFFFVLLNSIVVLSCENVERYSCRELVALKNRFENITTEEIKNNCTPTTSLQTPPFWHGFDAHSFVSISHLAPSYPIVQLHLNESESSTLLQVLLCLHGFGVQ